MIYSIQCKTTDGFFRKQTNMNRLKTDMSRLCIILVSIFHYAIGFSNIDKCSFRSCQVPIRSYATLQTNRANDNKNDPTVLCGNGNKLKISSLGSLSSSSSDLPTTKQPDLNNPLYISRRASIAVSLGLITSSTGLIQQKHNNVAWAAVASEGITDDDKVRIKKGYDIITYLLNNFDQETTVCRENGGECKRNADAIRKALGLRSTTDPFFQIEKVFAKAKYMSDTIDIDKLEVLFDATEDWNSAVSMSNSMAFISQFGEYNPGGGADSVLKFLLESKKQVLLAKSSLEKIMDSLDIPR